MHELLKKDKFDIKIFKNHLRNCRILNAKLYTLSDVYSYASLLPEDDLLSLDRCKHERWDKLKKIMNVRSFGDRDVVHKAFDEAREGVIDLTNVAQFCVCHAQQDGLSQF